MGIVQELKEFALCGSGLAAAIGGKHLRPRREARPFLNTPIAFPANPTTALFKADTV